MFSLTRWILIRNQLIRILNTACHHKGHVHLNLNLKCWLTSHVISSPILTFCHKKEFSRPGLHQHSMQCCRLNRLAESRVSGDSDEPWYVGWSVCQPQVAQRLHQLYNRPAFINPHSTPPRRPWIFIGKGLGLVSQE